MSKINKFKDIINSKIESIRIEGQPGSWIKECLVLTEKLSASGDTDLNQPPVATPLKVKNASSSELRGKFFDFILSNEDEFLSILNEPCFLCINL